jgi:AcrR family transcriptional regulator
VGSTRRARKRAQDRQEILAAAAALFSERGFARTSMQAIARRAEFSVGKLYAHFRGKHEIFGQLVESYLDRTLAAMRAAEDESLDPIVSLRRILVAVFRTAEESSELVRLDLLEQERRRRDRYRAYRDAMRSITEKHLARAVRLGRMRDVPVADLARMIGAACEELAAAGKHDRSAAALARIPDLIMDLMILPLVIPNGMPGANQGELH